MTSQSTAPSDTTMEYVTFRVADQWLGMPVLAVQEVLVAMRIARIPMAPVAVAGFLNLRGQIVTAIDLRTTLELPPRDAEADVMNVVVRHDDELFAFMVDEVGDVVAVPADAVEATPSTLSARWRTACTGVVRRERSLLLVMSVHQVLGLESLTA